jgi:hypothetical protein
MTPAPTFKPSIDFVELVARTHDPKSQYYNLKRPIPTDPKDLWNAFLFPMFVGGRRKSAQVSYAVSVLEEFVSLQRARKAQTDGDWTPRIKRQIEKSLRKLGDYPPDGLKRAILEDILADADGLKLSSMAAGMTVFIDQLKLMEMGDIRGDLNREFEFVVKAVGNGAIAYVGYTRFVLWMHACNAGWTLTPPNGPVRWAMGSSDLGFTGTRPHAWNDSDAAWELGIGDHVEFGQFCTWYYNLAQVLQPQIDGNLTAMEVQSSAWILGATHALMMGDANAKAKFSAKTLIRFLDSKTWSVAKFEKAIGNIDACLPLIQELKTSL